jgi:UDP-GlcNAc:undecaprenyl-phosphate/decaprenyl-phosphate GlcNAc-1-phosphate transferase
MFPGGKVPIISILLSCAFASAMMPIVLYFAHKYCLYDKVNERKIHNGNIPRLGGVGIVFAFMATLVILMLLQTSLVDDFREKNRIWPIFICGAAMFLLGLMDDFMDLNGKLKLFIQTIAALFLMGFGYRFRVVLVPWGSGFLDLGIFSYPITLIWIIGITNAINLIDGLDGLAGGISLIAALTFGIIFWVKGQMLSAEICMAIVGAAAGFLIFNLPPAAIFMGDSGSLFLGFCLALLPLLGQRNDGAEIGLISAATTLSIPIFDTLMAIYRRKKAHISFFTADKGHFHHIMLAKLESSKTTLAAIYGINIGLALIALSTLFLSSALSFSLKLAGLAAMAAFFFTLSRKGKAKSP